MGVGHFGGSEVPAPGTPEGPVAAAACSSTDRLPIAHRSSAAETCRPKKKGATVPSKYGRYTVQYDL